MPDGDGVVCGLALREGFDPFGTSLLEYAAYRDASRAFADSGLASQRVFTLAGRDEPERVQGAAVMAGYLAALAVSPIAGRALTADDDRPSAPPVAILSYELWQRRFGGDRAAIGTHLSLDGAMHTVIGVMPPGFDMPAGSMVWVPLQIAIDVLPLDQRAATAYGMVARLNPGVSIVDADARVKTIARRLGIAEATVKVHLKGLLRRIRVANRTQAAIWAMNNGIGAPRSTGMAENPGAAD